MVGLTPDKTLTNLNEIVRDEVSRYVGYSPQEKLYAILDSKNQVYAVVGIPHWPRELPASIVVMARVIGEYIVIEEDTTDKPLYEALMANAGIPREQIILAYAGETIPPEETSK